MATTINPVPSGALPSWDSSLGLLSTAQRVQLKPALAGFDGFVDTILHVVSERRSATEYTRVPTLRAFSEKILAASGGRNMNIEMVPRLTKIGGNGPILANALAGFDIPVTYIGCLGSPVLHPVFHDFAKKVKTYSIAEPGFSDAIEFADGKLICGKQQTVSEISWKSVLNRVPIEEFCQLTGQAGLIAFVNWGIVFSMTEIMEQFLQDIGNRFAPSQKPFFIDTADPSKRSPEDIGRFVKTLPKLAEKFKVYLGFNLRESAFVARAAGLTDFPEAPQDVLTYSKHLRKRLGIHTLIVHWSKHAVATDVDSAIRVEAPFTDDPRISTGAGDHFNAGFCLGILLGGDLECNTQLGVATSGYYVREAKSPTLVGLVQFIETLSQKRP